MDSLQVDRVFYTTLRLAGQLPSWSIKGKCQFGFLWEIVDTDSNRLTGCPIAAAEINV